VTLEKDGRSIVVGLKGEYWTKRESVSMRNGRTMAEETNKQAQDYFVNERGRRAARNIKGC
jgi:hypothetical protein